MSMQRIIDAYKSKKEQIRNRLSDFKTFYNEPVSWFYNDGQLCLKKINSNDNERIFEEMVFCILTANGSAKSAMIAVDASRDVLMQGNCGEIQKRLKKSGVRFHNRAKYIVANRDKFSKEYNFDFKKILNSKNPKDLREFFSENVLGFGYKESSHFLRNIGVFGLTILDKHILRTMQEYNIIEDIPINLNKKKYIEIEQKFKDFSEKLHINMDELDLLLWSMKTGKIMK